MATQQQNQTDGVKLKAVFDFFNEIGIINQLATTAFNRQLPAGLHVSHFSVLSHLVRLGDGRTPVAIAQAFQVTKGTMTNTLTELERRGFVSLKPNPQDRRSKLVMLRASGRKFYGSAIKSLAPMFDELSEHLDVDRLVEITPQLQSVRQVLDKMRN